MTSNKSKRLLVEGRDDMHSVIHLMADHIQPRPNREEAWPVDIKDCNGIDGILNATIVGAELKASDLKILGVIIDADADPNARWASFRSIYRRHFPEIPEALPPGGLITENDRDIRLGFWLMPDCSSSGMLETFLKDLVRDSAKPLWDHAVASFEQARSLNAPCDPAHSDKARVHTWLAWQEPPGQTFGIALRSRTLDPKSPAAAAFVTWFKQLYDL